jgi:hypothetical protein
LANKSVGELVQAPFTGTMYSNKESSTEIILMTVPSCLVHLKAKRCASKLPTSVLLA